MGECKRYSANNPSEVAVIGHVEKAMVEAVGTDKERAYVIEANGSVCDGAHYLRVEIKALHDFAV